MSARLERILSKLGSRHAAHLVPAGWETREGHLSTLARQLADYGQLVLMADLPEGLLTAQDTHVQRWATAYARLYQVLAERLFPSYAQVQARKADDHLPAIVVVSGDAVAVTAVMAGYVVPFIATRQGRLDVSEAELRVLMDIVLEEELMCDDLERADYNALVQDGIGVLKRLLALPVSQIALTGYDRPVFGAFTPQPEAKPAPPKPSTLPAQHAPKPDLEMIEDPDDPPTPTERLFSVPIPVKSKRRPPVPDLPKRDKSE